jgi:hypothetical protein
MDRRTFCPSGPFRSGQDNQEPIYDNSRIKIGADVGSAKLTCSSCTTYFCSKKVTMFRNAFYLSIFLTSRFLCEGRPAI